MFEFLSHIGTLASQLIFAGIIIGSAYALSALGLTLVWGGAKVINYAHGEFVMIGAYAAYFASIVFGVPPPLAVPLAVGITAVIGFALYVSCIGKFIKAPDEMESFGLILTFGLMIFLSNGAAWIFTPNIVFYKWMMIPVNFYAISTMLSRLMMPVITLTTAGVLLLVIDKTWFGRGITLVVDNPQVAGLTGVNIRSSYLGILIIGVVAPAIAGLSWSFNYPISPFIGLEHAILAFVVVILGGLGSPKGSIVGGLFIGIVETTLVYFISPGLRLAIAYSIFILVIMLRPAGLFGRR